MRQAHVEITGLARMCQQRTIEIPDGATEEAIKLIAREAIHDHSWAYQGMEEETIEVIVVAQWPVLQRKEEQDCS